MFVCVPIPSCKIENEYKHFSIPRVGGRRLFLCRQLFPTRRGSSRSCSSLTKTMSFSRAVPSSPSWLYPQPGSASYLSHSEDFLSRYQSTHQMPPRATCRATGASALPLNKMGHANLDFKRKMSTARTTRALTQKKGVGQMLSHAYKYKC